MIAKLLKRSLVASAALAVPLFGTPAPAQACGGFFCSAATLPINQAAEKIIFAENDDGTVTAVIQILYQGPAQNFSWLLPISSVPRQGETIAVASNLAFQRLQSATNPQYNLTTRVEGTCGDGNLSGGFATGGNATPGVSGTGADASTTDRGVTVEASGTVGAFDWTAISLDASLPDPADVAVHWLEDHGYLVSPGAPGLIRPYLQDGLYLLALRLTKGADTGSIRPLMLTYEASRPMIPIKLTAVAANDDMGVMTWLLSSARGVPQNYLALELNEARINWFNASANYNDVVTAAADEAGGQGFVAEFAGPSTSLSNTIWTASDESQWQSLKNGVFNTFDRIFTFTYNVWGNWDGYWDAVQATVTLTGGVSFADFKLCPTCYPNNVQFSPTAFIAALEANVIQPVKDTQALFDAHPYVTRLYTTMSASEMTVDPLFTFNPDLADVSNIHSATRVIECSSNVSQFAAPWRIELSNGDIVRGTASQVGIWPDTFSTQPANTRVLQLSASGTGAVVEDNGKAISALLDNYNSGIDHGAAAGSGGCTVPLGRSPRPPWAFVLSFAALAALRWRRRRGEAKRAPRD